MIIKLQKWGCPVCGTEYWSPKGILFCICEECGNLCEHRKNIWKINEDGYLCNINSPDYNHE